LHFRGHETARADAGAPTCLRRQLRLGVESARRARLVKLVDLGLVLGQGAGDAIAEDGGDDTQAVEDLVGPYGVRPSTRRSR
jgi:hypothetical protein